MKYHGNYCGPNWSAGKHQPSVVSDVPAVDEFDDSCRMHDAIYATNGDLLAADIDFALTNFTGGPKQILAAVLVGGQAVLRAIDKQIPNVYKNQDKKKMTNNKKLRGAGSAPEKMQLVSRNVRSNIRAPQFGTNAKLSTVPASYGFTLKMQPPTVVRNGNAATITGSDFAGNVYSSNSSSTYEPAASITLNPVNFQSAMLGSLARTYEKFRVKRASVQYIPQVATSTVGQLIMTVASSIKEPFIAGNSTTFLSRALSQGNAIATPLWREAVIELPVTDTWFNVDYLVDVDLDDGIAMEVQAYTQAVVAESVGILLLHYEFEFKNPIYVFHSSIIPNPYGNGTLFTYADNSAVNATTDAVVFTESHTLLSYGTVFRLVFQQARSTLPTGPGTWATVAKVAINQAATTTTVTQTLVNLSLVTGTVLYGMYNGGGLAVYAGFEEAILGGSQGALIYQTATTAAGTWSFLATAIHIGTEWRLTTQ